MLELRRNDVDRNREDRFAKLYSSSLPLSRLRSHYERRNVSVVNFLCGRNTVRVDDDLKLAMGTGRIHMDTAESTIDFHMTVANRIGLSAILPNVDSAHQFGLELDLKKEYREFKGKHGTLGFDPTGCMLFVGRSNNEDVFLAMAPDEFIANPAARRDARKRAAGSSRMSRRHYRQVVIMLAFFMSSLERHPFIRLRQDPYEIDLESGKEKFDEFTDALYVLPIESIVAPYAAAALTGRRRMPANIRFNFEDVAALDRLLVDGLQAFVDAAPEEWTEDGFILDRSPIVVTTRFGQNARICTPGNENVEAWAWHVERDYSKIAFLTVAIATSIQ